MNEIVDILIQKGTELSQLPYNKVTFTANPEADNLLNDLGEYPHAFVLACVMDRQIKAERAWLIPYSISKEIGGFQFRKLLGTDLDSLREIFKRRSLHRFNEVMAENFYSAIHLIHTKYSDNAANMWTGNPKSATVVRRFLEFKGKRIKISTMAANILAREFKIPMQDRICIDISPDVHVKRVFARLGLISEEASNDELIYRARELHTEYPGIFDFSAWEIGRQWCRPRNPDCGNCYLCQCCPKTNVVTY